MERLNIANEKDRLTVASILFKNGYTVQEGKEKQGSRYTKYIEYKECKK